MHDVRMLEDWMRAIAMNSVMARNGLHEAKITARTIDLQNYEFIPSPHCAFSNVMVYHPFALHCDIEHVYQGDTMW